MTNTEKLYTAFAEGLNIDRNKITDDLVYRSIAQWDSISHMVLISQIEEAFNISFETDDVIDLNSVAKAKEILGKHSIIF